MAAPTLTGFTDPNPCPRVLVTFGALAAGTVTITVQRTAEGRTMPVRGGVNLYAVGGAAVMDYEVPFGIAASYSAQQFNSVGLSLGFTASATVTVDVTDTWIHQPLSPALAVAAILTVATAADVVRKNPGSMVYPEGATVGRWIGAQRQGVTGAVVEVLMNSLADADELQSMFGSYSVDFPAILCIRTPVNVRLPRVLFAAVAEVHEVSYTQATVVTFSFTVDEVAPPAPGLVLPLLRRKDIDVDYPTRAARAADYATRLARDVDYTKAGLAG